MKIAACLHGLARGSSVKADGAYLEKFCTLLKEIKGADIFIHSWDDDIQDEIVQTFNPLGYIFEPQKDFKEEQDLFKDINFTNNTTMAQGNLFKTLSFLFSRKQSIQLKQKYETEAGFKYDVVLVSRFDVGHHKQGLNKTSHLKFNPNQDMTKMYQAYWDQTNAGASDHWFYSSSENIDVVSTMYDKVFEYLKKDSEYNKKCKEGWPLSCKLNEFSGELFKNERTKNLATYITGENSLINNHCLYKFFFMENDMWDGHKSVFLNKHLWND